MTITYATITDAVYFCRACDREHRYSTDDEFQLHGDVGEAHRMMVYNVVGGERGEGED